MAERYVVELGAGSLREESGQTVPHAWSDEGVSVHCEERGTHVLHLAVAGAVLDELHRRATTRGLELRGVRVRAEGALDDPDAEALGVDYSVAIDSALLLEEVEGLLADLDPVAGLPESLHAGIAVRRVGDR